MQVLFPRSCAYTTFDHPGEGHIVFQMVDHLGALVKANASMFQL